jgi:ABC-type methionine transport system ATPase subunit
VTTIVVAHRLSTIKDADNILVMKHGEVKEEGCHASLLQNHPDGIYAQFVRQQEEAERKTQEERKQKEIEEFHDCYDHEPTQEAQVAINSSFSEAD